MGGEIVADRLDNGQADRRDRTIGLPAGVLGQAGRTIGHFGQTAGTIKADMSTGKVRTIGTGQKNRTTGQSDVLVGQFGRGARDRG